MITPDYGFVCISRTRTATIRKQSLRLFPYATLCVAESERDDYHGMTEHLITHPDDVTGVGPVRNWVLDNIDSHILFIIPDDVVAFYGLAGTYARTINDPTVIRDLMINNAECGEEAGARFCGFSVAWDVRKFNPLQPFALNSWMDGPVGLVGRELRFDHNLKLHPDVDFYLQNVLKHRIVWQDSRYAFAHDRFSQAGGNALHRTRAAHDAEFQYLKRKWGDTIDISWAKTTFITKTHVTRQQSSI